MKALGSLPAVTEGVFTVGRTASAAYPPLRAEERADEDAVAEAEKLVRCEDTAVIIFTSGSTGLPKPVMTSHFSRVNGGIQQSNDFAATYEDVFCVAVPMFHCFTISTNIMASAAVGGCICLPDNRHTSSILRAIQQHRCTVLHAVPSMYRAIMARKDFADYDISSLRVGIIGGASYPPNDFIRIEEGFGMTLASSLGQTESTAGLTVCSLDDSMDKRSTTVGKFMNHVEGKIADLETGEALAPGKVGEICIKGYLVMQGYYHQPEQTAKAIDADGWLHTGDLGELDEDGDIILRGRIKELINRGGEKISPVEVENEICALPQVDTCRMIPVPDVHYGEEACACVVLHENMSHVNRGGRDSRSPAGAGGGVQDPEIHSLLRQAAAQRNRKGRLGRHGGPGPGGIGDRIKHIYRTRPGLRQVRRNPGRVAVIRASGKSLTGRKGHRGQGGLVISEQRFRDRGVPAARESAPRAGGSGCRAFSSLFRTR